MSTNIRHAKATDMPRLKEVINASFPMFYRHFSNRSVNSHTGTVLVSEVNGEIAGFARLTEFMVGGRRFGCVFWLAVHPDFRRRGVAASLVRVGVDWLVGWGAVAVFGSAGRENVGSIGTFLGVSFRRVGFLGLWRFFGWRVFEFYAKIWFVPSEVVLMFGGC